VTYDTSNLPHEPICSIQDAIKYESYQGDKHELYKENFKQLLLYAQQNEQLFATIEGHFQMGIQEHLYLETNATLVIREEQDELTVYSSTQNVTKTQELIFKVCMLRAIRLLAR
jgi:xanthine dehydrogenase large subunit